MPKRYFLSPIIGTGPISDPYRLKAADYATIGHAAIIPSKADGTPRFNWGIALLNATDLTTALADNNIAAFPDLQLDQTISAAQATNINAAMVKFSIAITVSAGETFRSVLVRLFTVLGLNFTDSGFNA